MIRGGRGKASRAPASFVGMLRLGFLKPCPGQAGANSSKGRPQGRKPGLKWALPPTPLAEASGRLHFSGHKSLS